MYLKYKFDGVLLMANVPGAKDPGDWLYFSWIPQSDLVKGSSRESAVLSENYRGSGGAAL